MSIDAKIAGLTISPRGVFLNLERRDKYNGPGQQRMEVVNPPDPPALLEVLVGEYVWGGSGFLMLGDTKFADRIGYTKLKLLEKKSTP